MPQSLTGAWRAVSDLCQLAIGTAQPVTELLNFEGTDLMEPDPETFFENTTEITGSGLPTKHKLLNMKFAGKHKCKATPTVVALFASMAMGEDTATAIATTTAYSHKLQLNTGIVEMPLLAGTEYVGHIPIIGGVANGSANYGIDIVLPRIVFKDAKKGVTDGILKVAGKFAVLADPTFGGCDIRVTNLFSHSYLATA